MHRLFLVLMIVLLPLRGGMGDVMASEMAALALAGSMQPAAQAAAQEDHAHAPGTAPHAHAGAERAATVSAMPDCADHAGSGHSPSDNAHCMTCVVCQACNTVGLAFPVAISAVFHATPAKPSYLVSSFTSAERALGLKPPIS